MKITGIWNLALNFSTRRYFDKQNLSIWILLLYGTSIKIENRVFILATLSLKNAFVKSACLSFSLKTAILKVDIRHVYFKGFIAVIENIFSHLNLQKNCTNLWAGCLYVIFGLVTKAYWESCQISKMEHFP